MKTNHDEPLEEIWAIRRQIAEKLGHDPKRRVAHYQQKQKQLGASLYKAHDHVTAGSPITECIDEGWNEAKAGQLRATKEVRQSLAARKKIWQQASIAIEIATKERKEHKKEE